MSGKGDSPRPFSNYEKYLENWDKAFGYNECDLDFICDHMIDDEICKYCGKSVNEIHKSGDSYYV